MRNVYLVRFETVRAFSTARKCIEFVKRAYDGAEFGPWGEEVSINDVPTEKLITMLNKGEYLSAGLGGHDRVEFFKEEVQ